MPESARLLLQRLALLLALAWMGVLYYLSDQPSLDVPSLFPWQDKVFHAFVYGVLGFLLLAAHRPQPQGFTRQQALGSAIIASLYGISDEIHQYYVPGRSTDVWDWVADTLGALLAVSLLVWLSRIFPSPWPSPRGRGN